ncbi:hypothetical protein Tco_0266036 [Tanacetum coccineum]
MVEKPVWNNARRVNHQNSQRITHPHPKRNFVTRAVLMKSGLKTLNTARQNSSRAAIFVNTTRPINTAYTRPTVNCARPVSNVFNRAHSYVRRPFNQFTTNKNNNFNEKVNTVKGNVTTVRPKAVGNPQLELQEKGVINSGCSRHTTGNKSYLSDYEEIDGGFVAFGGSTKGGKITGKGKIRIGKLDFKDLTDENHVLLKVPRKDNMYSVDLRNVVPQGGSGPEWLFDIDTMTKSMNYKLVIAGNQSNGNAGTKVCDDAGKARVKKIPGKDYIPLPLWHQDLQFSSSLKDSPDAGFKPSGEEEKKDAKVLEKENGVLSKEDDQDDQDLRDEFETLIHQENDENVNSTNNINTVSSTINTASLSDNDVDENIVYGCEDDPNIPNLEEIVYSDDEEDVGAEADMTNLDTHIPVSPIPTTKIHKDHPVEQIIGDIHSALNQEVEPKTASLDIGRFAIWQEGNWNQNRSTKQESMREVCGLENKARLVALGYISREGLDYDEDGCKEFISIRLKRKSMFVNLQGLNIQSFLVIAKGDGIFITPDTQIIHKGWLKWNATTAEDGIEVKTGNSKVNAAGHYLVLLGKTIYVSYIEQFWSTAKTKTVNNETQIRAKLDSKTIVITESSMRKDLHFNDKDGTVTPLFATMLIQSQAVEGEGSGQPTEPQHTPTTASPSHSSGPTTLVADETVYEEMGDSMERAATTAISLDAEQGSVNTLRSGEDSMKLNELMEICTKLSERVLALENIKTAQDLEITNLKKRVKKLEKKKKSRTPQLKRRLFKIRIESFAEKSLETQGRYGHDTEINTASTSITTASIYITTTELVIISSALVATASVSFSTAEPIELDEKVRLEREREEEASNAALIEEWDTIEARIDADAQLAKRLQAEEREQMNKPPTKAEQRKKLCTYMKHMAGYKDKDFKGKSFDAIKQMFDKTYKQVNDFVPMDTKSSRKKAVSKKRAGERPSKESVKRQKIEDDAEKAELKACLEIVPGDDSAINIKSLATEYPIVD